MNGDERILTVTLPATGIVPGTELRIEAGEEAVFVVVPVEHTIPLPRHGFFARFRRQRARTITVNEWKRIA